MTASRLRALLVSLCIGAAAGVLTTWITYAREPGFSFEMDRGASTVLTGLYEPERAGQETFAWTRGSVQLALDGLDRSVDWTCSVRMRGGRTDTSTLPAVVVTVDGIVAATADTTNEYQELSFTIPVRSGFSRTRAVLAVSNTFTPGPSDPRTLGVVIDRWNCAPASIAVVRPPAAVLLAAAVSAAAFAAAFVVLGASLPVVLLAVVLLGFAQAIPLAWEFAPFTDFASDAAKLAVTISAVLAATHLLVRWRGGDAVTGAAVFVLACTGALLYLKLLALAHPSKLPIDIVFHGHRLAWVLDGRFFFTQPMPGGVQFPYAIGLYVFAAPWSLLTSDYGFLLRVVVTSVEAAGALLVYVMVARLWRDEQAGVIAAVLYQLVPRSFNILHNANMTNAFGQFVAFIALAAAVLLTLDRGDRRRTVLLTLVTAWALLSHVSTFTSLSGILVVLSALYWIRGSAELRTTATRIFLSFTVAAVLAVGLYYGWFGEAYRSAARVRAVSAATGSTADAGPPSAGAPQVPAPSLPTKLAEAGRLTVLATGWPILLLSIVGAVPFLRRGIRDRLSLAVLALSINFVLLIAAVLVMPIDRSFERYAAEFISRVTLATYPAVVLVAGLGAAWLWRVSILTRAASVAALAWAASVGISQWLDWMR